MLKSRLRESGQCIQQTYRRWKKLLGMWVCVSIHWECLVQSLCSRLKIPALQLDTVIGSAQPSSRQRRPQILSCIPTLTHTLTSPRKEGGIRPEKKGIKQEHTRACEKKGVWQSQCLLCALLFFSKWLVQVKRSLSTVGFSVCLFDWLVGWSIGLIFPRQSFFCVTLAVLVLAL